jgi:hypothetical protein
MTELHRSHQTGWPGKHRQRLPVYRQSGVEAVLFIKNPEERGFIVD